MNHNRRKGDIVLYSGDQIAVFYETGGIIMIHLKKIDYRNVWDIINLEVTEPQEEFVASNRISLVQAMTKNRLKRWTGTTACGG